MRRKTAERLTRIEQALEDIAATLVRHADALNTDTPGGLGAVMNVARDAKTAAESAFVGMQTLASQATVKPGLPEVVKAVTAQTDALRAMEQSVRSATGPQPALKDELAPMPAPSGMGSRTPPSKPRGGKQQM